MKEFNPEKSCLNIKCENIPVLTSCNNEEIKNNTLRMAVINIMHELGIYSNTKGYFYLVEAIMINANAPNIVPVTKTLYPSIAKIFNTSAACVERAIRHTIETAWIKGYLRKNIFGYTSGCFKRKPKNSEFIITVADYLKLKYY